MNEQIQWSQKGSGSSCRSFVEPWALWEGHSVKAIDLPYAKLLHQVIAIEVTEKKVSSSEAHRRVTSSPRFDSRPARATQNLETLLDALENQRWQQAYQVCWDEFHDMHALFHESDPAFSYFTSDTQSVLDALTLFWKQHGDGPLITMDAGPNIHLLYRPLQHDLKNLIHDQFKGQYHVL
jgi:diphosphomevalonate decarboxylase